MSLVTGAATYKKKSGIITIYEDRSPAILLWKAADSAVAIPSVEIVLTTISHLQATPANSEKMMLKIITKQTEAAEPVNQVFGFNNRIVMDNIKESLQQIVARHKSAIQAAKTASESPAPEKPLINTTFLDDALDSKKLLKNHQLQQKLLLENKQLMSTFKEAVMNQGLDPAEFWTTRVHLLRAFALSNSQKRGPYNVLSTIKPTATSDNQVNVSVTREKIHAIFEQYPVVRKAYDDNVPRLSEGEFWSRFFSSKLFRKLRGEKINNNARGDLILDKYINMDVDYEKHEDETLDHKVNKTIDLAGNKEDDSTKLGNGPDMTMKPNAVPETISVLKSMNRLSQKMVNSLEHEYSRSATPGVEKSKEELENERIREELLFKDLEQPEHTEYAEIALKPENETREIKKIKPPTRAEYANYTENLRTQVDTPLNLQSLLSDERKRHIEDASSAVLKSVRTNSKQSKQSWQVYRSLEEQANHQVLDESDETVDKALMEQLRITHGTSVEFLRHFWLHFSSGDPSQANNIKSLYNSLLKSQERIKVALEQIKDEKSKQQSIGYMKPLNESLAAATSRYKQALSEAST
ncbi:RNA polymerase II transcription factor B subunit 1 [Wickerhamomyces ciferrii]|uniref:RNA polymerase II transcription factor B subunit 1 n=1 Tax=Wickerhamomyces ciferrii (strain ATCC 14091 / BCRC 22168 / CBS 111 / JCM 3599 / NBRC 0793 / NRRL Y-1031 F-60-10) TaxID=1206466 RepID=K0KQD0_WICCF|nr:RNA polymerase II transcription factor B subunit 1 [Wickerhamomyces ciferrii]CCH45251.1 RNA polymerase II transcription factor B subunit 1 [Wickerhamomyces ciferrii]